MQTLLSPFIFKIKIYFLSNIIFSLFIKISIYFLSFPRRIQYKSYPWVSQILQSCTSPNVIKSVYTIKVYTKNWSMFFDGKFAQRIICQSYPVYTKFDQSFYPKLPFSVKLKNKRNGCIRSWFRKDVLIGQFPSKSIKVFRKIGWVSIPSKSIKVFHEGGGGS